MSKKILVAVAILMTSGLAYADRDGLLLSAGFGLRGNKLIYVNEDENVDLDASWGGAFQLKLGGIINHQHALYLHFQNSLFSFQETSSRDEFAAFTGFNGLGYTYFANPTIGSPYIEATIGRAAFVAIESASTRDSNSPLMQAAQGSTFLVGAGYEFNNFMQAGITLENYYNYNNGRSNWDLHHLAVAAKLELKIQ